MNMNNIYVFATIYVASAFAIVSRQIIIFAHLPIAKFCQTNQRISADIISRLK